ncbi:MAG: hypothetical protein IPP71_10450 [Bacteroidetes bacterium]|nr:hypothetical protein [Bacteroidota bacterium]
MKTIQFYTCLCLLLIALFSNEAKSQEAIDLTELKAPSSPAFSILGVQPNDIARPKTFEALEANLFSSISGENNTILPNNYALEFSPYWLMSHPKVQYKQLQPSFGQTVLQNASISVATNQYQGSEDTSLIFSKMGFGFRTMLIEGKTDSKVQELVLDQLQKRVVLSQVVLHMLVENTQLTDLNEIRDAIEKEFISAGLSEEQAGQDANEIYQVMKQINENNNKSSSIEESKRLIEKTNEFLIADQETSNRIINAAKSLQEANLDKKGFMIEFAGALVLDFPENNTNYSKVTKYGVWLTPGYRFKDVNGKSGNTIELLGVMRYLRNEAATDFSDNIDLGLRAGIGIKKLSFSGEIIHRYQRVLVSETTQNGFITKTTKSLSDTRYDFNIEYKISDKLVLAYTFGQNFTFNTEFAGNLISVASLNFGFGGPKMELQ